MLSYVEIFRRKYTWINYLDILWLGWTLNTLYVSCERHCMMWRSLLMLGLIDSILLCSSMVLGILFWSLSFVTLRLSPLLIVLKRYLVSNSKLKTWVFFTIFFFLDWSCTFSNHFSISKEIHTWSAIWNGFLECLTY